MSVPLRMRIRRLRDRMSDPHLQQVGMARRALQRRETDVLVLGDSSCLFGSPEDPDPAMIPELVGRELVAASPATVTGAGFGAHVYADILRYFGTLPHRPAALVVAASIRTNTMTHVLDHPVYRHRRISDALRARSSARHRMSSLGHGPQPTPADYQAFLELPVKSRWGLGAAVGDYRDQLQGRRDHPLPDDLARVLFDYFHGEILTDQHWGLEALARFGEEVASYGVPTAVYWTAPPLEYGERLFPGEFTQHVRDNLAVMQEALASRGGPTLVDTGLTDADFTNCSDGTEHYALSGRQKVAAAVAAELAVTR